MAAIGRWLLALAGGLVWGACFGREPLVVAPWLVLVPLLLLLSQPKAAALGFAHGVAFWLLTLPWIVPTLEAYGDLAGWLARLALLALASYLALFQALFAAAGARLWRCGGAAALFGLPALWVAVEWLRGHLFTGFPWNLAAYAWIEIPGALPLAAWVGASGVSYLVVLSSTGLALAVAARRWRIGALAIGLCLAMLALAARWATGSSAPRFDGTELVARVLQPNIGVLTEWDEEQVEQNYRKLFELSRQACDAKGALLVWPESAAWPYSYSGHPGLRQDLLALATEGCGVLVNTAVETPAGVFNSVLLVTGEGVEGRYDKRHLVPYGEYVPMARWLPFLQKLARNTGDFLAGEEVSLLVWGRQRLATSVCFEVTFPEEVAEQVRAGATVLVTVTNDAWYGDSWAPWQHYAAARFRAAENRRYLLRAAITGVSAVVAPDGSVEQQLGVGDEGLLAGRIAGRTELTPYSRAPRLVPSACIVVVAFAILLCRRGSNR